MTTAFHFPVARDPHALLDPLHALAAPGWALEIDRAGEFSAGGRKHAIPRLRLRGPRAGHDPIRLGLFAGLHGDEPAGCHALVELAAALVAEPARASGYDLFIYPVVNPTGYVCGTRENHAHKDLNREFWLGSDAAEIAILEDELRRHRFDGLITLHADDTCEGVYGYAHGRTLNEALLEPALRAAEKFLPRDRRATIDGFTAREGLIHDCFTGVLSAPGDQRPRPFDLIFETPAREPLDRQIAATVAALEAILSVYPGFISYAQDL